MRLVLYFHSPPYYLLLLLFFVTVLYSVWDSEQGRRGHTPFTVHPSFLPSFLPSFFYSSINPKYSYFSNNFSMLTTDIPSVEPGATDSFKAHSWLMDYAVNEENEEAKQVSQEKEDVVVLKKKKSRDDLVMPSTPSGQLDHLQQQQKQPPPQPAGNLLDKFGVSFDFHTDPVIDSPLFSSVSSPSGEKGKSVEDPVTASTTSPPQTPQSINEDVVEEGSFDPDVRKPIRTRRPSIASMLIRRSSRILSSSAFSKKDGPASEAAAVGEPSESREEDDDAGESVLDKSQESDQEEEQEEQEEEVPNSPSAELPLKQEEDDSTPISTASISIPKALDRRSSRILDGITRKVMHVRHTTSMVFRRATSHVSSSIAATADKTSPNSAATTNNASSSGEELQQVPSEDAADISSIEEEEEENQDGATSSAASSPRLSSIEDDAEKEEENDTDNVKTTHNHHSTNISMDALSRKLFLVKNSVSRMKNIFASKRAPPTAV